MSALTPGEAWSKMTLLGIGFIETKTFPGEPCARLFLSRHVRPPIRAPCNARLPR